MKKTYFLVVFCMLSSLLSACGTPTVPIRTATPLPPTGIPVPATNTPSPAGSTASATETPTLSTVGSLTSLHMFADAAGWAWASSPDGSSPLLHTSDGGLTWAKVSLPDENVLATSAFFLNANYAWLVAASGMTSNNSINNLIYRTSDGGRTWNAFPGPEGPNLALDFYSPQLGWLYQTMGAAGGVFLDVFQTNDGGQTWTRLMLTDPETGQAGGFGPGTIRINNGDSLILRPPGTIWNTLGYSLLPYAGLIVSWDGGKIWEEINPPLPSVDLHNQPLVNTQAPQFVPAQDGYLPVQVGAKLRFFITRDEGKTWRLLSSVIECSDLFPWVQFVSLQDGFAVCDGKLWVTRDGAQTWQAIAQNFAFGNAAGDAAPPDFVDATHGWSILIGRSTDNSLIKTDDGGQTWTVLNPQFK